MIDLENDTFHALCQVQCLSHYIEDGGTIRHVRDDIATIDLPDDSSTEINLRPVQHLLNELRRMTE